MPNPYQQAAAEALAKMDADGDGRVRQEDFIEWWSNVRDGERFSLSLAGIHAKDNATGVMFG